MVLCRLSAWRHYLQFSLLISQRAQSAQNGKLVLFVPWGLSHVIMSPDSTGRKVHAFTT